MAMLLTTSYLVHHLYFNLKLLKVASKCYTNKVSCAAPTPFGKTAVILCFCVRVRVLYLMSESTRIRLHIAPSAHQ